MPGQIFETRLAIVGGGKFCKAILEFLFEGGYEKARPHVLGVADMDENAAGMRYARDLGIPTSTDYTQFYEMEDLETILELTRSPDLPESIRRTKPAHVRLIDHFEARTLWDFLQVENAMTRILQRLWQEKGDQAAVISHFERFSRHLMSILKRRNRRSKEIEMELHEHERTLFQIIQGSTIPTFVLNAEHIVTHWNKAMERLTGFPASQVVGTHRQWAPFYGQERHTMADVILDQIDEQEIRKLYGTKWRKSALIEGAYEAEGFFPQLGENGKWCWFTAAPIKAPDGRIIGAIETLWDKTEDRKAEEERERRTRELAALCSIYTALSAPWSIEERTRAALEETRSFMAADSICIFLLDEDYSYHLKFSVGAPESLCRKSHMADENSTLYQVAKNRAITVHENLPDSADGEIRMLGEEGIKSIAYIPISAKEEKVFGVIRIGSKKPRHFNSEEKNVLELIGNRIGVAIENAVLQEKSIKSEEKYRSLFNNDPNPIFILHSDSFRILDTNRRAEAYYGYTRRELIGMYFPDLGGEDHAEIASGLRTVHKKGSILFSKRRHYKKNGKPFFVNINVSPAEYGESDVLIASATDITETVEKETQLIQASKMTTLGVMAAGMAHEINQPLNVIQICADYFLKMVNRGQEIGEDDLKMMANDIVENVQRIAGVIKHVRDFSRQSEVVRTEVNINDPIRDVFKVLGHQLKVHEIDLQTDLAPDLPPIMAQHNRLEQVFINLVTNAIDALDEKFEDPDVRDEKKSLTIRSFLEDTHVVVHVTDNGTGMPEEVKNKIFEPFFTTKKTGTGTGLGVSISYGIVKDYDGTIQIESEPGRGTTFIIKFPAGRKSGDHE